MRSIKTKLILSSISLSLFFLLLSISICQWNETDVYETSGVRNGWWVGPLFNYMRRILGQELSASLTLILAFLPLYVAVQYWRGRIK